MKTKASSTIQASALIVTLVTTVILAFTLASFLMQVSAEHRSVARAMAWQSALPVAESGIEEALTQIYYTGTNVPGNFWTSGGDGFYRKTRSIGNDGSYYTVALQLMNPPVIYATGYVRAPLASTSYLSRAVQVKTTKTASPKGGVIARGAVKFSGGAYLDSFDSSDSNYNTNGLYTSAKRKDNGLVIANSGSAGIISLSGGGVYGSVITGPGGTVAISSGAKVGDAAWLASGGTSGVQAGRVKNDANVDFPAVTIPFTVGLTPSAGTYNASNYTYLLGPANYYQSGKLTLSDGQAMGVTGDTVLYVDNDFTTSGSGFVYMYPGASLTLYINGVLTVSGTGIINDSQRANKLTIYGLNTASCIWKYGGSATFYGTIYAPKADFTFSGSAGATGSFTANTVTVSGSVGIHFDESLVGGRKGFVVASWNEL